ncbi:MAG: NADH-quinone oxidoreductase subunit A [Nitrospinae bacterium]|nr:NADH-quinone oxidoreductase subunit A [Nitrospinota bacterium]
MLNQYVPVFVMTLAACGTAVAMIVLTSLIGPKKEFDDKMEPFECGVSPVADPKARFSVRFYIIAMLFILFDIEAVFLFPWAVVFRELGMFGFVEMMVFLGVLGVGLVYVWKKGALEWE